MLTQRKQKHFTWSLAVCPTRQTMNENVAKCNHSKGKRYRSESFSDAIVIELISTMLGTIGALSWRYSRKGIASSQIASRLTTKKSSCILLVDNYPNRCLLQPTRHLTSSSSSRSVRSSFKSIPVKKTLLTYIEQIGVGKPSKQSKSKYKFKTKYRPRDRKGRGREKDELAEAYEV